MYKLVVLLVGYKPYTAQDKKIMKFESTSNFDSIFSLNFLIQPWILDALTAVT